MVRPLRSTEFFSPSSLRGNALAHWNGRSSAAPGLYSMYGSFTWADHLASTTVADGCGDASGVNGINAVQVGVIDSGGAITGVIPFALGTYELLFGAWRRVFHKSTIPVVQPLGEEPELPADPELLRELIGKLWQAFPQAEGIYFKALDPHGPLYRAIRNQLEGDSEMLAYSEERESLLYSVRVPENPAVYYARFRRKKRYNLKRQERVLRDYSRQNLTVFCAERVQDVPEFLADAASIFQNAWQRRVASPELGSEQQRAKLLDLARRGLLRSYVLRSGGVPCAFILGYQWKGIFHYADVGYDSRFTRFSPGSVLFCLMLEDLATRRPAQRINLGIGASEYKRQFATDREDVISLLLLKRNTRNRARVASHALFRKAVGIAKRLLRLKERSSE